MFTRIKLTNSWVTWRSYSTLKIICLSTQYIVVRWFKVAFRQVFTNTFIDLWLSHFYRKSLLSLLFRKWEKWLEKPSKSELPFKPNISKQLVNDRWIGIGIGIGRTWRFGKVRPNHWTFRFGQPNHGRTNLLNKSLFWTYQKMLDQNF